MGKISDGKIKRVKNLYYRDKLSMKEIAGSLNVSIDAIVYFMRKHGLKRRNFSEINKLRFDKAKPSFRKKRLDSARKKELKAIGSMLYWGEGYKSEKSSYVDFSNSDPQMIKMFLKYLRGVYRVDENKFRVLLYCYSNQNVGSLIDYWSELTGISKKQFTKPYVKNNFSQSGRKMEYGMVHIRYIDKKLLLDIKDSINSYKLKFCVGGGAVNRTSL